MKKIFLSALLGLAIVVSCEKKQEDHADHADHATTETQATTDEHAKTDDVATSDEHNEDVKLELNNGEKWTMNAEMKPFIAEMEKQINAYKPETDDYKTLGADLNKTNEGLIKSCTIKGTPHDVLHAWLMPHMQEIDKLTKAENKEKANEIVKDLKESMEKYHEYFN